LSSKPPGNWLIRSRLPTKNRKKTVQFCGSTTRVELYIDNGDGNWNKSAFDSLLKNKPKIEEAFGDSFVWERLDDKRASVIRFSMDQYGIQDKEKWPELQDQMIEAMIKFEKAFRPFIQKIG